MASKGSELSKQSSMGRLGAGLSGRKETKRQTKSSAQDVTERWLAPSDYRRCGKARQEQGFHLRWAARPNAMTASQEPAVRVITVGSARHLWQNHTGLPDGTEPEPSLLAQERRDSRGIVEGIPSNTDFEPDSVVGRRQWDVLSRERERLPRGSASLA